MTEPVFDAAPIRSTTQTVLPDWIDYNGHMNVAYYLLAFDRALDEIYDLWGNGPALVESHNMGPMALQSQLHYLRELLEGERFHCEVVLLDCDHKRVHVFVTMISERSGEAAATYESLSMNVDLGQRRSTPFPDDLHARLDACRRAQADLPRPPQVGARIGIRRR
ncbi:MAG: thioesterase family protein [Paracoccaceae bacterium]